MDFTRVGVFAFVVCLALIIAVEGAPGPIAKAEPDLFQDVVQGVGNLGKDIKDSTNLEDFGNRLKDRYNGEKSFSEEVSSGVDRIVGIGNKVVEVAKGERGFDPNNPLADKDGFLYTNQELLYGILAVAVAIIVIASILKCLCSSNKRR